MPNYKRIPVKERTAELLHEQKQYGESWDDTLRRLAGDGE
jgi:hypothetical protein